MAVNGWRELLGSVCVRLIKEMHTGLEQMAELGLFWVNCPFKKLNITLTSCSALFIAPPQ